MINQIAAPKTGRTARIVYWAVTGLLCLNLVAGIFDSLVVDAIRQSTQGVGFPLTILPFLGTMKILGAVVLLFSKSPVLKIAAYAGVIFYFMGAVAAHLTVGQPVAATLPALVTLGLAVGSYWLWRRTTHLQLTTSQSVN